MSVGRFCPWDLRMGTGGKTVFGDEMNAWVEGIAVGKSRMGHRSSTMRARWKNEEGMSATKRESTYVLMVISNAPNRPTTHPIYGKKRQHSQGIIWGESGLF